MTDARPVILDLFCGAGGAAWGYHLAGWDVVGVDIVPQPRYPFEFHQADAIGVLDDPPVGSFDAIHASPPCQDHSTMASMATHTPHNTGWMLAATIDRLRARTVPWVVENVDNAQAPPEVFKARLCGSSFGLRVRRHRWFWSNNLILSLPCQHREQGPVVGVYGHGAGVPRPERGYGVKARDAEKAELMGMPWATPTECNQAIPPAYTEYIGHQLMTAV